MKSWFNHNKRGKPSIQNTVCMVVSDRSGIYTTFNISFKLPELRNLLLLCISVVLYTLVVVPKKTQLIN